jgi:hypothetical protein
MGHFRFAVPTEQLSSLRMWEAAYVCGIEGVPWEGRVTLDDGILTVSRGVDDSGKLFLPFPVGHAGPTVTLSTCSLRETGSQRRPIGGAAPHLLPLELARGECFRLRTQADNWRRVGLQVGPQLSQLLEESTERFLRAATMRSSMDEVGVAASQAIEHLYRAGDGLADCYWQQALAFRKQNERQLNTLVGAMAGPEAMANAMAGGEYGTLYRGAFNTLAVPVGWGAVATDGLKLDFERFDPMIDWAKEAGLSVIAGPLFDFNAKMLPEWLYLYEDDFSGLVDAVENYVERTVVRYNGKVTLWHATAGLNTRGPLLLDEEQVMRLAVAVIHTIRRVDPRTPVLISVDQPWGEYLGGEREGISPIHFADALIRSNLGVGGIGLEMRMNYADGGGLPRSLLDFGQQIDRWQSLGLPLLVQLAMPAASGEDALATRAGTVVPLGSNGMTTPELQARTAMRWIKTMLAKGGVHGVIWEGWDDRFPHAMPHSGLIDRDGQPRPLLHAITQLRSELLK